MRTTNKRISQSRLLRWRFPRLGLTQEVVRVRRAGLSQVDNLSTLRQPMNKQHPQPDEPGAGNELILASVDQLPGDHRDRWDRVLSLLLDDEGENNPAVGGAGE